MLIWDLLLAMTSDACRTPMVAGLVVHSGVPVSVADEMNLCAVVPNIPADYSVIVFALPPDIVAV